MADVDRLPAVNLLVMYCAEPKVCEEFYARLGLSFTTEKHGSGPEHLAAVIDGGCVVELYPLGKRGPTLPLRLGLSVPSSLVDLDPGQHILQDPDGRTVVVDVVG